MLSKDMRSVYYLTTHLEVTIALLGYKQDLNIYYAIP